MDTTTKKDQHIKSKGVVPEEMQAELLHDIKNLGGISKLAKGQSQKLCNLCNLNPSIYGNRGDPIRENIRELVRYWLRNKKAYKRDSKRLVGSVRAATPSNPANKEEAPPPLSATAISTPVTTTREPEEMNKNLTSAAATTFSPPAPVSPRLLSRQESIDSDSSLFNHAVFSLPKTSSTMTTTRSASSSATASTTSTPSWRKPFVIPRGAFPIMHINVDVDHPFNNREVMVFKRDNIQDKEDVHCHHHGFQIYLPADLREILVNRTIDQYNAWLNIEENTNTLKVPSWWYPLVVDMDSTFNAAKKTEAENHSLKVARNDFLEEPNVGNMHYTYMVLRFPTHITLYCPISNRKTQDGLLPMKLHLVDCSAAENDQPPRGCAASCFATWGISRTDINPKRLGDQQDQVSSAYAVFQGLSLN